MQGNRKSHRVSALLAPLRMMAQASIKGDELRGTTEDASFLSLTSPPIVARAVDRIRPHALTTYALCLLSVILLPLASGRCDGPRLSAKLQQNTTRAPALPSSSSSSSLFALGHDQPAYKPSHSTSFQSFQGDFVMGQPLPLEPAGLLGLAPGEPSSATGVAIGRRLELGAEIPSRAPRAVSSEYRPFSTHITGSVDRSPGGDTAEKALLTCIHSILLRPSVPAPIPPMGPSALRTSTTTTSSPNSPIRTVTTTAVVASSSMGPPASTAPLPARRASLRPSTMMKRSTSSQGNVNP